MEESKRSRKRKPDESSLSPEEKEKKRKNRDAAKKCREKKEKEAKQLKERNNELEIENSDLSKEKIKLQKKISEYKEIIHRHISRGCKLPPDIEMVFQQEDSLDDDDINDFREVGYIESPYPQRMHTPPHTPDSSSSDKMSPPVSMMRPEAAPTALFSGTPLPHEVCRRRHSSSSRSPSRSPGPQGFKPPVTRPETKDLSQLLLTSKKLPPVLAPIQSGSPRINLQPAPFTKSPFPTVVIDDEDDDIQISPNVDNILKGSSEMYSANQKLQWVPVMEKPESSSILNKAFEHPDIPSDDVISNQLFEKGNNQLRIGISHPHELLKNVSTTSESENLHSLGFTHHVPALPEGYSYTEDLAEIESVNKSTEYLSENLQYITQDDNTPANIPAKRFENPPTSCELPLDVYSSAILALGPDVSDTLHEQIKKKFTPTAEDYHQLQQQDGYVSNFVGSHTSPEKNVSAANVIISHQIELQNVNRADQLQDSAKYGQQITVQKLISGQPGGSSAVNQTVSKQYYFEKNGQIYLIQTANPLNIRSASEQTSATSLQQNQQPISTLNTTQNLGSVDFNLPSLNFDDLEQNGNIFDKTKSSNFS
ncbi:hypothetical protein Btru_074146 [Bulinus truncatus]|nr:hypothetical protein Btru_074146 [Bulinus truncatus]